MIKQTLFLCTILIAALFVNQASASSTETSTQQSQVKPLNRLIAIVNNEPITQSEFDQSLEVTIQEFKRNRLTLPKEAILKKAVLEQLINKKLQLQLAKRNNIKITKEELNHAIQRIAAANHLTMTELKQKIAEDNVSYVAFTQRIKNQLIISKIQRSALSPQLNVSESEIKAYRKEHAQQITPMEYHVASVLIPLPASPTPAVIKKAKQQALTVLKQLNNKQLDFKKAQNSYPGSVDLQWRRMTELPELFQETARHLTVNELSHPIQAANGFHILKLLGKRANDRATVSGKTIEQILMQRKFQAALTKWLKELRKTAYIRIYQNNH